MSYSRFHETLTTNDPNFVAKFVRSFTSGTLFTNWLVNSNMNFRNELANFATKFGTFVVKVS